MLSARSTLAEADGWWLTMRCPGRKKRSHYPCRLLSRQTRPDLNRLVANVLGVPAA